MSGSSDAADVTGLLLAWGGGDEAALAALVPRVHAELRQIAQRAMARERRDHTLEPTALVNEVYLRLVDMKRDGKRRLYVINPKGLETLEQFLASLWPAGLRKLKKAVESDRDR